MNMNKWLDDIKQHSIRKPMPILSFPGIQVLNIGVKELVKSGELQSKCMKAIADKYDTLAAVTLMDLSVEAEAFGSPISFSAEEVPTVTARIIETEEDIDKLKVP